MAASIDIKQIPALQKTFWDRPPSKDKGDAHSDATYRAVGFALSQWELCEQTLASLVFPSLIETSSYAAARAYGAVESNSSRRKVILAAAEAFFGKHWEDGIVKQAFTRLIEAVGWAASRRDDIAHGIVTHWNENLGSFHMPPRFNTGRTNTLLQNIETDPLAFTQAKYRYTSDDINGIGENFHTLNEVIFNFGILLRRREGGAIPFVEAVKG